MTRLAMTRDQAVAAAAVVLLAAVACVSPVHNDTWWHLAYGREMATVGGFGQWDHFSFTASGQSFTNHQWLAQPLFYALWTLGGLPLLTAFCAALIVAGWALGWRLTRGPLLDRLLVTAAAVAGSTLVWSIRPQVFTVALLPFVLTLLVRGRYWWLPPVMLVWANLHGGVLLGLIAVGVWVGVAALWSRRDVGRLLASFVASVIATQLTPLGLHYWPEVVTSLARSQGNRLQEWQPPAFPPDQIFFWGLTIVLVIVAASRWRGLTTLDDRALVVAAAVQWLSAVRALRNVAPFMMLAAPAITRLLNPHVEPRPPRDPPPARAWLALPLAVAIAAGVMVLTAWRHPWARLGWEPMSPKASSAIAGCPGPLYNTYAGGGPIIWFVPGQKVFLDSRQDQFPEGLIASATDVENGADYRPLFAQYGFRCAALPPSSPTVVRLEAEGWTRSFNDDSWVVLWRPDDPSGVSDLRQQ